MEYNHYTSSPSASPSNTIFSNGPCFETTSDSSSPNSPHLNHVRYNGTGSYDSYHQYMVTPASYYPPKSQMKIPIALSSSTLDEKEQRRKRNEAARSQDKETIPNMHLRRRAQNRASQRAFRERKEKHVKGLEHQLEELHEKHQDLLHSYSKQVDEVAQLYGRIAELAAELHTVRHCPDGTFNDMMMPDKFDAFSSNELTYHSGEVYYDKASMDLNSEFVLHSYEDSL